MLEAVIVAEPSFVVNIFLILSLLKDKLPSGLVTIYAAKVSPLSWVCILLISVAKAFAAKGAQKELAKFLEADIKAGLYNSYYENDDELTAEENAEAKAEAEERSKEYIEFLREYAQYFIVDDDAFDLYVDYNFGSAYSDYEEYYGERNLRMAEQLNKLMDYLVGVKGTVVKHNDEWEFKHVMLEEVKDEVTYYTMSFHNSLIKYTVK